MNVSRELYTPKTLCTLAGGSFAVVAASGAIGYAFDYNPKWLGLAFALVISIAGLALMPGVPKVSAALVVVAFFNGMLIYSQAVGLNTMHDSLPKQVKRATQVAFGAVPWWGNADMLKGDNLLAFDLLND